jgi:type I restriction enzyme, R subunit
MGIQTEQTFEAAIEQCLLSSGWAKGLSGAFDRENALHTEEFLAFVASTQAELWRSLRSQHGSALDGAVVEVLLKALDSVGTLEVLRHGFKFYGKRIAVAYFKPAHGLNPEVLKLFEQNRLMVTRQVKFDPGSEDSIDMMLSLNGLPVATAELKNHLTGQNVHHAVAQYKSRDQRLRLFQFKKRALVHFAVDSDQVYMATRLSGSQTFFLPFNRGLEGGAGNGPHPSGYKAGYLWQEVWQRESFLDILGKFLHLEKEEEKRPDGKKVVKERLIFPRYHQLDAVRRLEHAARSEGAGQSYLIQHSAGSGKSNSIGWLAHRLSVLHDAADGKVFDSVIVITDRRVLDKQLQDTIYQFEHKQGVVEKIDQNSTQLAEALQGGVPIIITTLQKFPYVTEKIGQLPSRRYALIVDEAHSSQSGESARHMKEVLAVQSLDEATAQDDDKDDLEDRITQVMQSRGRQSNLSFFAFTATPKAKTLEVFGRKDEEGKPRPYHLYTMRQAIEEGFILDVLKSYTTYKAYYRLVHATTEDPEVNKKRAATALARFMSLHPHNISQKTEVMVEHFRQKVRHKLGGKAKAMVVTSSRLHAVRYKQAFEAYIKEKGYNDVGVLVAFSGTVKDPEVPNLEYTEVGMNQGIKERELPDKFHSDEYQVLLVANKYQTGFDEPLLHTMYVDKRLSGVQAVQTLSRLNRTSPGKTDTFVLDFVNDAEEIQRSFQPYFEQTTVSESADPQQLYELQAKLDASQVYTNTEVENLCKVWYAPKGSQTAKDHAELYRYLSPAVDRFKALEENLQEEFRGSLKAFVNLYAFLAQVMPFQDPDLERRYTFGRFLQMKLPPRSVDGPLVLDDEVQLKYYRLQQISQGDIVLNVHDSVALKGPTDVGTRTAKDEKAHLSEIIEVLNERFGTEFKPADQLFFDSIVAEAKDDEEVVQQAQANELDNFALAMKGKMEGKMVDRIDQNSAIVERYLNEKDFQEVAFKLLVRKLYEEIRKTGS